MDKKSAIDYLVKIGLLIPFDDNLKLYHGRAREPKENGDWEVIPNFNNAGNNTGNNNLNKISSLYTSEDYDIALEFGQFRSKRLKLDNDSAEVHRIVSSDKDALFFNGLFDILSLPKTEVIQFQEALTYLVGKPSQMAPVKFEYRKIYNLILFKLMNELNIQGKRYCDDDVMSEVFMLSTNEDEKGQVLQDAIHEIAGILNSRTLLMRRPDIAVHSLLENIDELVAKNGIRVPINLMSIANWLKNNHIIGKKHRVDSVSINKTTDIFTIFDLPKVNTVDGVQSRQEETNEKLNPITSLLSEFTSDKNVLTIFKSDDPQKVIERMHAFPDITKLLDLDAGLWEQFTVGEHTETVLRVFEESFANDVPVELKPFIRLLLLSHDIGKGLAVAGKGVKYQHEYTLKECRELWTNLGVDPKIKKILEYIIFESQEYTTDYYVKKNKYASYRIEQTSRDVLAETFGKNISNNHVLGLMALCKILQTCDSGAYTRYAVTRNSVTGVYHYNANDLFTKGFQEPYDLTKTRLRFNNPGEENEILK